MSAIYELIILLACIATLVQSKGATIQCVEDFMNIEIALPSNKVESSDVYLDGMKGYPNPRCQPTINNQVASFRLPLQDFYECGVTRIVHKLNGKKVFKHKIIIEQPLSEETVTVECTIFAPYKVIRYAGHNITRRDIGDPLPLGFEEPTELDITTLEHKAPVPNVSIGVRQGGQPVSGELNVSPGTPLSMEIYLDDKSSDVYGLGVTFMLVTDNKSQEETIIFNGCSVDPYLFENFVTTDGDFLSAKFRAFKFPDSTYVQFRGTVNACINKCKGIQCSNGQIGYGRRKREIDQSTDSNNIYEISKSILIHVVGEPIDNDDTVLELQKLKIANQKLQRNSRGSVFHSVHDQNDHTAFVVAASNATHAIDDRVILPDFRSSASSYRTSQLIFSFSIVFSILMFH